MIGHVRENRGRGLLNINAQDISSSQGRFEQKGDC